MTLKITQGHRKMVCSNNVPYLALFPVTFCLTLILPSWWMNVYITILHCTWPWKRVLQVNIVRRHTVANAWNTFWATAFVKQFALCYQTVGPVCEVGVGLSKRLDGSRWNLAWRWASARPTLC